MAAHQALTGTGSDRVGGPEAETEEAVAEVEVEVEVEVERTLADVVEAPEAAVEQEEAEPVATAVLEEAPAEKAPAEPGEEETQADA